MNKKGRRYDKEPKLNMKKVFGVLIGIAVIIMVTMSIINLYKKDNNNKSETISSYYTVYYNNLWGVINNLGEIVIEPVYSEFIAIPNKNKDIFVCTYDVNDTDGTYKTKVINSQNQELFTDYSLVEAIDNKDSKNNIWYEDNVLRVQKDGKWGLIDFAGNQILPCEYDKITALTGVKNNFIVSKDGQVGLVNDKGQSIISVAYSDIVSLKDDYKNEYIVINNDGKKGLISTTGKVLIEPQYEDIKYINSTSSYAAKLDGVWKLVSSENTVLIDSGYDDIISSKGDNVIVIKNSKYGVITTSKQEVIPFEYEELKYAFSIYYIAKKDGKYGVITSTNEQVLGFTYKSISYIEDAGFIEAETEDYQTEVYDSNLSKQFTGIISEVNINKGYIRAYIDGEYKYYNFKFEEKQSYDILTSNTLFLSKKDGKYGYINKSGDVVIDYIYDDGTEQNSNGYCGVKQNGVWGSINKIGAEALEPSLNLDNSLYIDFIGNWHLSDDGLYYTK